MCCVLCIISVHTCNISVRSNTWSFGKTYFLLSLPSFPFSLFLHPSLSTLPSVSSSSLTLSLTHSLPLSLPLPFSFSLPPSPPPPPPPPPPHSPLSPHYNAAPHHSAVWPTCTCQCVSEKWCSAAAVREGKCSRDVQTWVQEQERSQRVCRCLICGYYDVHVCPQLYCTATCTYIYTCKYKSLYIDM